MDINKFVFSQMFNDSKGKTSSSLFSGVLIIFASVLCFTLSAFSIIAILLLKLENNISIINFFSMLVMQSIAFAGIGSTLLGIHRLSKDKEFINNETDKKE